MYIYIRQVSYIYIYTHIYTSTQDRDIETEIEYILRVVTREIV